MVDNSIAFLILQRSSVRGELTPLRLVEVFRRRHLIYGRARGGMTVWGEEVYYKKRKSLLKIKFVKFYLNISGSINILVKTT